MNLADEGGRTFLLKKLLENKVNGTLLFLDSPRHSIICPSTAPHITLLTVQASRDHLQTRFEADRELRDDALTSPDGCNHTFSDTSDGTLQHFRLVGLDNLEQQNIRWELAVSTHSFHDSLRAPSLRVSSSSVMKSSNTAAATPSPTATAMYFPYNECAVLS